jgi:signal transduction histidine kinase
VEPGSVARRAAHRVTPAADSRGVKVELDPQEHLPSCQTDANRVEQILVNLLGNAIQHTPEGSRVRLAVRALDRKVIFVVEDEGGGVPETELERIFDIYASKKEGDARGVGLGLPLSRRLARLLGGELRAVMREGKGGCFILELPAAPT